MEFPVHSVSQLCSHGFSLQHVFPDGHRNPETLVAPPTQSRLHFCLDTDSQEGAMLVLGVGDTVGVGLSLGFGQHLSPELGHVNEPLENGTSPPGHLVVGIHA